MNEIFIFAQTRSGSTLLQRAINQTPDTTIYGEHGGMLHGFAAAYYQAIKSGLNDNRFGPEVLKDPNSFAPCYSGIHLGRFTRRMRHFLETVLNPHDALRWGFKEVRYGKYPTAVFDMLAELFPTAKFVFLVRDPREQISSVVSLEWKTFDDALQYWINTHAYFMECAKVAPNRCRLIEYNNLRNVRKLFDWLELENPRSNLFKEMPRTGHTEIISGVRTKYQLSMRQLSRVAESGALDSFVKYVWGDEA